MGKKDRTKKAPVSSAADMTAETINTAMSENMNSPDEEQQQQQEQNQQQSNTGADGTSSTGDNDTLTGTGGAEGSTSDVQEQGAAGGGSGDAESAVLGPDSDRAGEAQRGVDGADAAASGSPAAPETPVAAVSGDTHLADVLRFTGEPGQMNDGTSSAGVSSGAVTAIEPGAVTVDDVDALIEETVPKVKVAGKLVLQNLQAYIKAMNPRLPMSDEAGARHQVGLYRVMTGAINGTQGDDFALVLGTMLKVIHMTSSQGGVFHDTNAFRFTEHIGLPEQQRKTFRQVLHFLKLMADPKGRKIAIRQVQFEKVFGADITPEGVERIKQFFEL